MYYTIYKITNMIDGKIYIGAHKTTNLDDDYMGGGKYLRRAQKKYGIENFEKEILEVFDSSEAMFEMESMLVTPEFVERKDTYNLKEGGEGGFDHLNTDYEKMVARNIKAGTIGTEGAKKWRLENPVEYEKIKQQAIANFKIAWEIGDIYNVGFKGKTHSEETKKKMSIAKKGKGIGNTNSQYGTMWIHSLTEKKSQRIKKEELSIWEDKGWLKGRKIKFFK